MLKVLIVDDSALTRKYLSNILSDVGFVVEIAKNGQECLDKISTFCPNVIILDINMPVMDGMTCLGIIMQKCPTPVIMMSSLTEKGATTTLEALELGAFDYMTKPQGLLSSNMKHAIPELIQKLETAAATKTRAGSLLKNQVRIRQERIATIKPATAPMPKPAPAVANVTRSTQRPKLIVIGVSTGGPKCLQTILHDLPANFPIPIVVAQHMPARFTEVFAQRLNNTCKMSVQEVNTNMSLLPGNIYIAQGNADILIKQHLGKLIAQPSAEQAQYIWHPSVTCLVETAMAAVNPKQLICVQLTGMGNDGAQAMKQAHTAGAITIAESQETAIVYGMPKELVTQQGASFELANTQIASTLLNLV